MPFLRNTVTQKFTPLYASVFAFCTAMPGMAQQSGDPPSFRLGLSTGLTTNSNRGLDATRQGSTTEFFSRLDFGLTFATPIQQLVVSGDIGLRTINGAESDTLKNGFADPNLRIDYARQSRDAELSLGIFIRERDASTTSLEFLNGIADPTLVTADGTSLRYGFDAALELRRRSPFGITLSAGYDALRYSDTTAVSLTDQDRFRLGAALRFDLNDSAQATLDLRYRTFEDFGTVEGIRETIVLGGNIRQNLKNGNMFLRLNSTFTEDGDRYSLSAGRTLNTPLWELSGSLGLTRTENGDIVSIGTFAATRSLPDGTLGATFNRSVNSGSEDNEQEVTSLNLSYAKQLNSLTSIDASFAFNETDNTAAGGTSNLSTFGINLRRNLTSTWRMDVGLQHRVSKSTTGVRARDNQLSINLRHDLSARR